MKHYFYVSYQFALKNGGNTFGFGAFTIETNQEEFPIHHAFCLVNKYYPQQINQILTWKKISEAQYNDYAKYVDSLKVKTEETI